MSFPTNIGKFDCSRDLFSVEIGVFVRWESVRETACPHEVKLIHYSLFLLVACAMR